jgi:hypothetical protein
MALSLIHRLYFLIWTTHLQLVPRSRKRGSIHPLPHTSSWRSAQLVKHRNKFTYITLPAKSFLSSLGVAWQPIPTMSSASVFHGSEPRWLAPVSQLTLQPSHKGYSSSPYGSRTAIPNRHLKTVLLCPGPPACRPTASELTHSLTNSRID